MSQGDFEGQRQGIEGFWQIIHVEHILPKAADVLAGVRTETGEKHSRLPTSSLDGKSASEIVVPGAAQPRKNKNETENGPLHRCPLVSASISEASGRIEVAVKGVKLRPDYSRENGFPGWP